MEDNEIMSQEMDAALDAEWDDSAADQPQEAQEATEAVQESTEQEAQTQEPPESEQAQETQDEAKADQPETFTLKNRDETRTVSRDELIAMAQKGWDYDTVRAERDQLRQYRDEADPAMSLIKSFAQRSNMTIGDYLDYCRKQELLAGGVNEATAQAQLELEKQQAAMAAEREQRSMEEQARQRQVQEEEQRTQARKAEMVQFLNAYPDVKPADIPPQVWAQVSNGTPLTVAYTMYQNQQLRADLAAERQNKENRSKTTGSMSTAGAAEQDELDAIWYSD